MATPPTEPAVPGAASGAETPLRDADLSIDDDGRFRHAGTLVTHPGLLAALWRGVGPGPGGWQVRIGREAARLAVDGTPWRVRGVAVLGDPPAAVDLLLTDGTSERLDPLTLQAAPDGVLCCRVKGGWPARFTRAGHLALGALLEEAPAGSGGWRLVLGGTAYPLSEARDG